MPKWAGGQDAPAGADPNLPVGNVPGATGYGTTNAYWRGQLEKRGEGNHTGPKEMFDYLKSQGASDNEALLLTGAASSESSFNPNAQHDPVHGVSTGHGLFGHKDTRLDMRGLTWQQQSVKALDEARRMMGGRINAAHSPEELADLEMHYEMPRGYKSNNPRAGDNYMGRLNSIRRFSVMTGRPAASAASTDHEHDPYASRTFGRYIRSTKPLAARGEMPYPHGHVPGQDGIAKVEVVKQPLDPARQKLAEAMHADMQQRRHELAQNIARAAKEGRLDPAHLWGRGAHHALGYSAVSANRTHNER